MSDLLRFVLAVLLLLVTPGPTNTVMATAGAGVYAEQPRTSAKEAGITALPMHDGIMLPTSKADQAARVPGRWSGWCRNSAGNISS